MSDFIVDADAERLMGGAAGSDDPDLGLLVRFTGEVRDAFTTAPPPQTRAAHLAAIAEAHGVLGGGVAAPARKVDRRRLLARGAVASSVLILVGGSALAASGSLPAPAQNAVARVARFVGVSLPRSGGGVRAPASTDSTTDRSTRVRTSDGPSGCRTSAECARASENDISDTPSGTSTRGAAAPTPVPTSSGQSGGDATQDSGGSGGGAKGNPLGGTSATPQPAGTPEPTQAPEQTSEPGPSRGDAGTGGRSGDSSPSPDEPSPDPSP